MASGKRASMREGPLAALFRKTEEEGLHGDGDAERERRERRAARSPEQRLREVFSTDIPENIMELTPSAPPSDGPRYGREEPSLAASAPAPVEVLQPVLRVVGVGGAGVNAV